jgi:hypothetical protein
MIELHGHDGVAARPLEFATTECPSARLQIAVIEAMKTTLRSEFVFPGGRIGRPLSNMAMLVLLRRMGRGDLTSHGFRSCFADWCAERTDFSSELREMAPAHVVNSKVEAAYRRGDMFQKRPGVDGRVARFVTTAPAAGKVVAFAAAKAGFGSARRSPPPSNRTQRASETLEFSATRRKHPSSHPSTGAGNRSITPGRPLEMAPR